MSSPLLDVPPPADPGPTRWQRPGWPAAVALLVAGLLLGAAFAPREVEQVPGPERTPVVCVNALDQWQTFKSKTAEYVGATSIALSDLDWSAYRTAAEDFGEWLTLAGPRIDQLAQTCRATAA